MGFQLTLGLKLGVKTTFENFIAGENAELVERLKTTLLSRQPILMSLCGAEGSGKTHLMQAACQSLVYQGFQAGYIDLNHLSNLDILNGLHQLKLVCFDQVNALDPANTLLLSEFIKTSLEKGHQIIISSHQPLIEPSLIELPYFEHHELKALAGENFMQALRQKADERGLIIPHDVEDLVLTMIGGSMKAMSGVLNQLEQRYDQEKKKTKFFKSMVKSMLKDLTINPKPD